MPSLDSRILFGRAKRLFCDAFKEYILTLGRRIFKSTRYGSFWNKEFWSYLLWLERLYYLIERSLNIFIILSHFKFLIIHGSWSLKNTPYETLDNLHSSF
jgi:hypothetical protein